MTDVDMDGQSEMLATRRSKRSTAGNRMEAALAEMALEEVGKDLDDDIDFINEKDEEDIVVGSDFESTDEEEQLQVEAAAEAEVANDERRARKAARSRLEKATAAAHAKHKATFNPELQLSSPSDKPKAKLKPRVALGVILDAESGEVISAASKDSPKKKRMSKRKHTVLNTSATVTRLKESEAKKASQPKKAKIEYKKYTQAELIARALDTEETNIIEHRDYLKIEDEKRKRARVVRTTTEGPLLRWVSRIEDEKVEIPPPPPPPQPVAPTPPTFAPYYSRSVYGPPGSLFTPTTYTYSGGTAMVSTIASSSTVVPQTTFSAASATSQPNTIFQHYQRYLESASSPFPIWPPPPLPPALQAQTSQNGVVPTAPSASATPAAQPQPLVPSSVTQLFSPQLSIPQEHPQPISNEPPPPKEPEYRIVTVAKNYLVHELAQHRGAPKPSWTQSMEAMFGNHVKWDEVKVYVGKNRPLSRIRHICPITGRQAHYLDPRSGVPYADSHAYKILTQLLAHEYVWSATAGCYLNYEKPPTADMEKSHPKRKTRALESRGDEMDVGEG
ncbi:hypothetical protein CVT26_001286 [Gymnopilus dilepis]|uniref:Vps72/YL1 C-terminal domain-containing protein n=1 Tax=Gymnopilus dilepis TaxID=231916 RepID=A0A409Y226_9AGAR|nr:hypothetical protein CVT26_001286 [Gymnopilus dilepis]